MNLCTNSILEYVESPAHPPTREETDHSFELGEVMTSESGNAETTALINYLNAQRAHAIGALEGLDDDVLRRAILPSGWTCLGMIQHLTIDIERFWFSAVIAGNEAVIAGLADGESAWAVESAVTAEHLFSEYRQEFERSNAVLASALLDTPPAWWPESLFGSFRLNTVREVVLHVLTEVACHAGHLDAARELIDGKLWMVLD